jgi:hypothetical protein
MSKEYNLSPSTGERKGEGVQRIISRLKMLGAKDF